jgi:hypothetical protein
MMPSEIRLTTGGTFDQPKRKSNPGTMNKPMKKKLARL